MSIRPNSAAIFGAYGVAFLLLIVPVTEIILRVWPLRFGEVSWRYGAVGLLSNAIMTPLLGLLIGGLLGFLYGHRRMLRLLAILCVAGAVVLGVAGSLFVLDALQMRALTTPDARLAFDVVGVQVLLKLVVVIAILSVLGLGTWRSLRLRTARAAEPLVRAGARSAVQ